MFTVPSWIHHLKFRAYKLLRSTEKYTRTDMVYLTKNSFWLGVGQTLSTLISIGLSIAFANLLNKEAYGSYRYILSILGILTITTLPEMDTAITQAVARGYEGALLRGLRTKMRWGMIGGLLCLGFALYYHSHDNLLFSHAFIIAAAFIPFLDPLQSYDAYLQGKKLFRQSSTFFLIMHFVNSGTILIALLIRSSVLSILIAYLVSLLVTRFLLLLYCLKTCCPNTHAEPQLERYGKHLSVMTILSSIANYFDRLLIFHYLGPAQVAVYSIAVAPPENIKGFLKFANQLALPKFSQRDAKKILPGLDGKAWHFTILILVTVVTYIMVAPFIFRLVFPHYPEAVRYSQLYALALLPSAAVLYNTLLQSQTAIKKLYAVNFITPSIQILFLLVGVSYGLTGVIIARILTRLINLLVTRQMAIWTSSSNQSATI